MTGWTSKTSCLKQTLLKVVGNWSIVCCSRDGTGCWKWLDFHFRKETVGLLHAVHARFAQTSWNHSNTHGLSTDHWANWFWIGCVLFWDTFCTVMYNIAQSSRCMCNENSLHIIWQKREHKGTLSLIPVMFVIRMRPRRSVVCVHSYLLKEWTLNKITKLTNREANMNSADRQQDPTKHKGEMAA